MNQLDVMREGENLEWCRPYYATVDGVEYWAIYENGKFTVLKIGEDEIYTPSSEQIERFASVVIPADQRDWMDKDDDSAILLNMEERGCTECPFNDVCDAMLEEIDDSGIESEEE